MSRLVVASNRVARPRETRAGGLAAAVRAALKEKGGLWFGWSGQRVPAGRRALHREKVGSIEYALLDLTKDEYDDYYVGFANRTLWPLLHFQPNVMQYQRSQYAGYRAVNRLFAEKLAPQVRAGDCIWVHDYHLIPLGAELRALGIDAQIGFFLHIPLPPPELLINLPCHQDLLQTLSAYDLVGVQTETDAQAMRDYLQRHAGATAVDDETISVRDHETRIAAFPISIDTDEVARQSRASTGNAAVRNLRRSLDGHKLALGVDRLDYSKGLPRRFEAVGRFFAEHSEWQKQVSYLQIAPPSREEVAEYRTLRSRLERIAGATNGRYAAPDWVPIRYVNRSFAHSTLAGFYRAAQLALVTPLRDGMNLVAKEFVAAQPPDDPGVLVLSCFAGAACEMPQAIMVNPYDPDALVEAIEQGLCMPAAEKRERWAEMFEYLTRHDIAAWRKDFLDALTAS